MYLVTGGNGYIGSHMCRYLVELGQEVVNIDNWSTSPQSWVYEKSINIKGDISDQNLIEEIFQKYKIKGIFHFAAKAQVGEGEQIPFYYYEENLINTIKFLEAVTKNFNGPFVFSSTCATFGIPIKESLDEQHPQNPINTYGRTKLLVEGVLKDLTRTNKLRVASLRYFNAAGCYPDGKIGENHDPETHLIPNICLNFLNAKNQMKIFGDQYPTPDGTCIRDYIHVLDLAKAHFQAIQLLEKKQGFHDFNLGTENGHSVKEVISAFEKVTGKDLPADVVDARPGDPPRLVSNSSKAQKLLNFKTEYTLEDCIQHNLDYLKKIKK
jgi:UDP-glucose 4-epimerase